MNPLRVVFITQEDPFYIAEFFRAFRGLRPSSETATFVGAFLLHTLGQSSPVGLLKRMHALYGGRGLVRLTTRYAVKRVRIAGHAWANMGPPVSVAQNLAAMNVPTRVLEDVNTPDSISAIRSLRPDVILSISATQKFTAELLSIPPNGCFNSHSGDLPRFRGMMPTFWTLYEGEPNATVTIHKMAQNIDAGDIWRQERIPISPTESLHDVILATKRLSASMMARLLTELASGDIELHKNDASEKTYYKFPTAKHSAELRRRGRKLL